MLIMGWASVLYLLATWWVHRVGVAPSFPYYRTILDIAGTQAAAVWAHFDGVYYLQLARHGYEDMGTQAFFPVYPLLIRAVSTLVSVPLTTVGQLISLLAIWGTAYVWRYRYRGEWSVLILTLVFPTAFYLFAVYTESLFLLFTLLFFVARAHKQYGRAAIWMALASGTRVTGILLALPLMTWYIREHSWRDGTTWGRLMLLLGIGSLGLGAYSLYLYSRWHDPLLYLHVQGMFGAERTADHIVLLPQVIYRYMRMLLTVPSDTWLFQRIWLELLALGVSFGLLAAHWRRRELGLNLYLLSALLLPTLTGTLSSLPRYILVLWPFLLPHGLNRYVIWGWGVMSLGLLLYLGSYFVHGIFVA
jgi:Gpi18-like mannosyltransferase